MIGLGLDLARTRPGRAASFPYPIHPDTGAALSLWIGLVTPESVTATARLALGGEARLVAWPNGGDEAQHLSPPLATDPDHRFCRGTITGLMPDTDYHLGIAIGGSIDGTCLGRFRTPPSGAHGFSFGAASCAATGSNALVFDVIREHDLDFFVHAGDMHYEAIAIDEEALFHAAFDAVFAAPRQNALWRALPMLYMWDDHDYGPNDSDRTSPARDAALRAFRRRVPVAPASGDPADAVHYSFRRGRVRFVVTDLRSQRSPKAAPDGPDKVVLGAAQTAWFAAELAAAREAGEFVCWINTKPWIANAGPGLDHWGGFAAAREAIAAIIAAEGMAHRLWIVSGDMHALAFDDGSNNQWGGFPVCQAAPLDRLSSQKGGPYTVGPLAGPAPWGSPTSQFGIFDVTDPGGETISIRFRGIAVDRLTGAETVAIDRIFLRSLSETLIRATDGSFRVEAVAADAPAITVAATAGSFEVS
jgi:diadenosine tetraphosphatase ApaH/serine/threonine PP2A family protein phosphatase